MGPAFILIQSHTNKFSSKHKEVKMKSLLVPGTMEPSAALQSQKPKFRLQDKHSFNPPPLNLWVVNGSSLTGGLHADVEQQRSPEQSHPGVRGRWVRALPVEGRPSSFIQAAATNQGAPWAIRAEGNNQLIYAGFTSSSSQNKKGQAGSAPETAAPARFCATYPFNVRQCVRDRPVRCDR